MPAWRRAPGCPSDRTKPRWAGRERDSEEREENRLLRSSRTAQPADACAPAPCPRLQGMREALHAPARARQRHASPGEPGLFEGRRICLAGITHNGSASRAASGRVAMARRIVDAEGGVTVDRLRERAGAASPSPSPEGATLLVAFVQTREEAAAAVKWAQVGLRGDWAGAGLGARLRCCLLRLPCQARECLRGCGSHHSLRGLSALHVRCSRCAPSPPAAAPPRPRCAPPELDLRQCVPGPLPGPL